MVYRCSDTLGRVDASPLLLKGLVLRDLAVDGGLLAEDMVAPMMSPF